MSEGKVALWQGDNMMMEAVVMEKVHDMIKGGSDM